MSEFEKIVNNTKVADKYDMELSQMVDIVNKLNDSQKRSSEHGSIIQVDSDTLVSALYDCFKYGYSQGCYSVKK